MMRRSRIGSRGKAVCITATNDSFSPSPASQVIRVILSAGDQKLPFRAGSCNNAGGIGLQSRLTMADGP